MRRRTPSRAWIAAGLALALCAGCETVRDVAGDVAYDVNPFSSTDLAVGSVEVHGPYLLAEITGRREQLRMLAYADGACLAVLRPEARVTYAKSGVFGRVLSSSQACDLVGTASLEEWRDRPPRRTRARVPRAQATCTLMEQDDQLLLARGRFPLASRVGISAGYDLVAVLPNDAPCRDVAGRGVASLEFRPAGRNAFRLLVGDEACVVTGFAMPPAGPASGNGR